METDTSEKSKQDHMIYYKSLNQTIDVIKREIDSENDLTIKKHLEGRIDAMNRDLDRIRNMFPDVTADEWNNDTPKDA